MAASERTHLIEACERMTHDARLLKLAIFKNDLEAALILALGMQTDLNIVKRGVCK